MRYFVLLMALVLSSCSHDDSQVNNGWVIYDLRPLEDGCIMYYGEDERISIFYNNRLIKFVGYQGEYNIGDSIKIVKVKLYGKEFKTRMSKMWHPSPASFSAHDGCRWI